MKRKQLRRLLIGVLAVGLTALGLSPLAASASAADRPNLALGKAASADGSVGGYPAANVTDGNQASYWEGPTNVFPQALSSLLAGMPGFAGEYLCVLSRDAGGREELTVRIECSAQRDAALQQHYREFLRRKLGVDVVVDLAAPKELAPLTGVETRQKPVRLVKQ